MKNYLLINVFFIVIGFCSSCSMEDVYSCDPEVNKWVNDNIYDISTMTRTAWLDVNDISYQRGIYNAFSLEQKVSIWVEKIEELLQLEWSDSEYGHLTELRTAILENSSWFLADCLYDDLNKKDIFMYQWIDYAANNLEWTEELIYNIVFTPEKVGKNKTIPASDINNISSIKTRSESGQMICDCHDPESAHYLVCGQTDYNCRSGGCDKTTWGCGWLWTTECNGRCYRR